jgi:hypothetical protein
MFSSETGFSFDKFNKFDKVSEPPRAAGTPLYNPVA